MEPDASKVLDTVPLGGKPDFAVAEGVGRAFVNLEDTSAVLAIDAKIHQVETVIRSI